MDQFMLFDAKPLSQKEIDQAIQRAHVMRSAAVWSICIAIASKVSKLFHSKVSGGSGLAHSS